ncbi:MAG: lysophospholipid acyltransferase family protein [Negativicutes bacterium]|jgi:KDO2-lipid IV(A) lauroyltransferase
MFKIGEKLKSVDYIYYTVKVVGKVLCLLPYNTILLLGTGLGKLAYKVLSKQRKRAIAQSRECLGLSQAAAETMIKKMFVNLGLSIMEIFYLPRAIKKKLLEVCSVEGLENVEKIQSDKIGTIILSAHYGNWEWMGAYAIKLGLSVSSIARVTDRGIDRYLNEQRAMAGLNIFRKTGRTVAAGAIKSLRNGDLLYMMMDGDAGGDRGAWVDFFGKKSSTHTGTAYFAAKYNAAVVPAFMRRTPSGHVMKVYPALRYEESDTEKDGGIKNFTQKLASIIEEEIRQYPENWLWFQKRWNTKWKQEVGG